VSTGAARPRSLPAASASRVLELQPYITTPGTPSTCLKVLFLSLSRAGAQTQGLEDAGQALYNSPTPPVPILNYLTINIICNGENNSPNSSIELLCPLPSTLAFLGEGGIDHDTLRQ
jgi:hypothetical protein